MSQLCGCCVVRALIVEEEGWHYRSYLCGFAASFLKATLNLPVRRNASLRETPELTVGTTVL